MAAPHALEPLLIGRLGQAGLLHEHKSGVFAALPTVSLALIAGSPTSTLHMPLVAFGTSKIISMAVAIIVSGEDTKTTSFAAP